MMFVGVCHAQTWVAATITSYHFERRGYNENNLGLGVENHWTPEFRSAIGFYRNSYYRETFYVMGVWMPLQASPWSAGISTGIATGYRHYPAFVMIPTVSYEKDRHGFNLGITPAFIGIQVKFRLD